MPAPVGSSITIYEAARGTGMTCMLFCVVLDIACIMCDIYCVPLALSFFLVADESNVGSLVGQKNSECSIYFSLTHQSATLLSLVVSFGLTIQQVHTGKKWTVRVKILVILKYSSLFFIPSASLFFFFFSPGWQSWVVQHLASELVLLYCRPGQQARGVQSSPSWQQPPLHHNEFCSSYLSALSSALFYLRRVWLNVKEKTFFFCLQTTRCSGGSKWCMWSNQRLVFVCFVFLRRRRGYIM